MVFKKRVNRKRAVKRRPMRKMRRQRKKQHELLVFKSPNIEPFPSRYRCKAEANIYGYIASGATGSGDYYSVNLNGVYLPFTTVTSTPWPNALPSIATLNCTGLSSLLNTNLYQKYRVYGSRIHVEFLPESFTDTIQVSIVPSIGIVSLTTVAFNMNQPFAVSGLMSAAKDDHNSRKGGSELRSTMTQHKLLGVSARAIEDDLSGAYTGQFSNNPSTKMYWVINWATPDGVALSANCKYRVRVEYFLELFSAFHGAVLET